MARKRELKAYNVIYSDGTYQTFDFTKEEICQITSSLIEGIRAVAVSFGALVLSDVRTLVEYKEPEVKEVEPEAQLTTGIPGGDMQVMAYLKELEKLADDAEIEGRMFY